MKIAPNRNLARRLVDRGLGAGPYLLAAAPVVAVYAAFALLGGAPDDRCDFEALAFAETAVPNGPDVRDLGRAAVAGIPLSDLCPTALTAAGRRQAG